MATMISIIVNVILGLLFVVVLVAIFGATMNLIKQKKEERELEDIAKEREEL